MRPIVVLLLLAIPLLPQESPEARLRRALQAKTGSVSLPGGVIEISREIVLTAEAHDLDIRGEATTIKASAAFRGRALIVLPAGKAIKIRDLSLDGNRAAFARPVAPVTSAAVLSRVVADNGILAEGVAGLELAQIKATQMAGFSILVSGGRNIRIHDVEIADSGSLDADGHNNGTGGIVLEEGASDFEILRALIGKVRGNGVWIRSADGSPGAVQGRIADSEFDILARAAVTLNRAATVTIENNTGRMLGFPGEEASIGGTALPAAIASTGGVTHATIRNNRFEQIAGRCLSLDGFGDGEVTGNECSEGLFNAILIRGTGNRIAGNRLTGLNTARREQPESLRDGIYLANGASGNTLEGNQISGYGMAQHCIGGPGESANTILKNSCSDGPSVARLQPARPR